MKKVLFISLIALFLFCSAFLTKLFAQTQPAVPPGLREFSIDVTSITIAWNKISNITHYEVWYSTDQSSFTTKKDIDASFSQYTLSGLTQGAVYYIHLNACDGNICSLPTDDLRLQTKIGPDGIRYCDKNINSRDYLAPYQTPKPICTSEMSKQECKDKNKRVDDVKSWYLRTDTFDGRRLNTDKSIAPPPGNIQDDFVTFLKEEIFSYHSIQPGKSVSKAFMVPLSQWYVNSSSPAWAVGRKVENNRVSLPPTGAFGLGPETELQAFVFAGVVGVDTICQFSLFRPPPIPVFTSGTNANIAPLVCEKGKDKNGTCTEFTTAVGPFSTDVVKFVVQLFTIILSLSGGIAVLLIIASGYQILTSHGNPEKLERSREVLTSTIIGLLFIIYSFLIFEIITTQILHIPGFI